MENLTKGLFLILLLDYIFLKLLRYKFSIVRIFQLKLINGDAFKSVSVFSFQAFAHNFETKKMFESWKKITN